MLRLLGNCLEKLNPVKGKCLNTCRTLTTTITHKTKQDKENAFKTLCIRPPRQLWVENLDSPEERKLELIELHPEVFAAPPRIDLIHQNIVWQKKYRWVRFAHTKTKNEVRGGGRKPWPQKGLGRARHGSIRSPLFKGGGVVHGPRSPTTHFFMLPYFSRVLGLTSALSVKLAQDDLHIVNALDLPINESNYLQEILKERNWGPSCLFVDEYVIFMFIFCDIFNSFF